MNNLPTRLPPTPSSVPAAPSEGTRRLPNEHLHDALSDLLSNLFHDVVEARATPARPTMAQQRAMFPIPAAFQTNLPGHKAICLSPAPQTPGVQDRELGQQLLSAPDKLLELIHYARWRSDSGDKHDMRTKTLLPAFETRKQEDLHQLQENPSQEKVAKFYRIEDLVALAECSQSYCPLNRLSWPNRRMTADRRIAEELVKTAPVDGLLRVAFLNSGGCFSEVACLQQIGERGYRKVEVHLTNSNYYSMIDLSRGVDIGEDVVHGGFTEAVHAGHVKRLQQMANWLAKNFEQTRVFVYGGAEELRAAGLAAGEKFNFFAALDPGLEPQEIARAKDELKLLKQTLGTSNAFSVLFAAGNNKGQLSFEWSKVG